MTRKQTERQEAIDCLKTILSPGDTVYTLLRSVSASGMFRRLDLYIIRENEPRWITGQVAKILDCRYTVDDWRQQKGLGISGCGMDMGFEAVYQLSRALFREGFPCIGPLCPSNDHSNGDRDRSPHMHSDGGYALLQRWI